MNIDKQLAYLKKGLAEPIWEDELRESLIQSEKTGRPPRVKAGFDPTAPDLHLGIIGDPTGRNTARPPTTRDEINRDAETYKPQVFRILDPQKIEVRFNSEWPGPLRFEDVVRLCSNNTIARILARDEFSKRYKEGIPISIRELLYPLAQTYDSVALKCDVEMGGTDQKLNQPVGREIQRDSGQPPQIVATAPRLEGTDVVEKMSKSKGNYIGITEPPKVMFRKATLPEIAAMKAEEPTQVKTRPAREIVADFHSTEAAERAQGDFDSEVRAGQEQADTETIKAGAVEIDGDRHTAFSVDLPPGMHVFRVGKQWRRLQL